MSPARTFSSPLGPAITSYLALKTALDELVAIASDRARAS